MQAGPCNCTILPISANEKDLTLLDVQAPDAAGLHDELHALVGSLAQLQSLLPAQQPTCGDQELSTATESCSTPLACRGDAQLRACAAGLSQLHQACREDLCVTGAWGKD